MQNYPSVEQKRILWSALTALAVMALLGVAALVFMGFISFLSWFYPVLLPLGLAVIVSLILEPVVDFLEHRGFGRSISTLAACVLVVVAFLLFWSFILPPLYNETVQFVQALPKKFTDFTSFVVAQTKDMPEIQAWIKTNLPAFQGKIPGYIANGISKISAPVSSALGFIIGFGFVPIYVFYFLADQDHLTKHWQEFVPLRPGKIRDEAISVLLEINQSLVSYLRGQIIVAAVNGVLTIIGLTLIDVPYSLVLGVMAGALSIVPFLGVIASIIPALILAFLSANGDPTWEWLKPLLVLVVFTVVQMSESMLVSPRVQSHSTGLHPLVIIIGILIWSMLLPGLLGPVVAVPLTAAVVVLMRRYVWLERKTRTRR